MIEWSGLVSSNPADRDKYYFHFLTWKLKGEYIKLSNSLPLASMLFRLEIRGVIHVYSYEIGMPFPNANLHFIIIKWRVIMGYLNPLGQCPGQMVQKKFAVGALQESWHPVAKQKLLILIQVTACLGELWIRGATIMKGKTLDFN